MNERCQCNGFHGNWPFLLCLRCCTRPTWRQTAAKWFQVMGPYYPNEKSRRTADFRIYQPTHPSAQHRPTQNFQDGQSIYQKRHSLYIHLCVSGCIPSFYSAFPTTKSNPFSTHNLVDPDDFNEHSMIKWLNYWHSSHDVSTVLSSFVKSDIFGVRLISNTGQLVSITASQDRIFCIRYSINELVLSKNIR